MKLSKLLALVVAVLTLGLLCFVGTGCNNAPSTADSVIQQQQERSMQEATRQTGLPVIVNFQEKKMMKMLYELRDREDLVCHAYLFNQMTGEVGQYLGQCIGYGLPASTQYSNPEKVVVTPVWAPDRAKTTARRMLHSGNVPQAEPNGLFMPEGLSATWLMMVDPSTGDPRPVYIEPQIIVSPFKL